VKSNEARSATVEHLAPTSKGHEGLNAEAWLVTGQWKGVMRALQLEQIYSADIKKKQLPANFPICKIIGTTASSGQDR